MSNASVPAAVAEFLAATGITWRQLDYWNRAGYVHAERHDTPRSGGHVRTWTDAELDIAESMGRLVRAGLRPDAAALVARHPTGGPVILGPGIVISLFAPQTVLGEAIAS